ncbi:MAG: glycosyltransferase family 39 protein, partial [Planctomycetota bacterium]
AMALRLLGLQWGLPSALHAHSYHPDEPLLVWAAYSSIYLNGELFPPFYNYPSLTIYLTALALGVGMGCGVPETEANALLIARIVTAIIGVAAVLVTITVGWRLHGAIVGLMAGIFLGIAPLHAQHTHFATVDVPSTLFVTLALGCAGVILRSGSWRGYILGGLFAGLAAGTKYNAGLVLLSVVMAHLLRDGLSSRSIREGRLWAAVACAAAALLASTPGMLVRPAEVLHDLAYEFEHAGRGHGLLFAGTGNGFLYTFASSLWWGLGPPLAVLFLGAVLWALWNREKAPLAILGFVIPYYALISLSQTRFARYALPLFPAAALLCGLFVQDAALRVAKQLPITRRAWPRLAWLGLGLVFVVPTLSYTVWLNSAFLSRDPRDAAAQWIKSETREGSRIGLLDLPWFYSPPLTEQFGFGTPWERRESARKAPYDIVILADITEPVSWWEGRSRPALVVISDYEIADALRLRNIESLPAAQREQVRKTLANLDLVVAHYAVRREFRSSRGRLFGIDLPHDMRYASPSLAVYEHRE